MLGLLMEGFLNASTLMREYQGLCCEQVFSLNKAAAMEQLLLFAQEFGRE
jgi:hypothetical protein